MEENDILLANLINSKPKTKKKKKKKVVSKPKISQEKIEKPQKPKRSATNITTSTLKTIKNKKSAPMLEWGVNQQRLKNYIMQE